MPEEIRGLSVKFDADFSEFKQGMKSAEKDINSTQKQLKTLQSSLNLKWDSKKFVQAQNQAQKALEATEQKAGLLRDRLSAMEKAGVTDKTRDEYNYLSEQLNKTELNAENLRRQLEQLDEIRLKNLTSGLDEAADKLNKAANATKGISLASGAAIAGIVASGLKSIETADEIATLATTYNMTTDAIQRFNYVALQTDTSSDYLYKGFVKVQAGVSDLAVGVESVATKALTELNLSFEQFDGAEDQFYGIIDALAKMEDQAKMVSLANDIFGERMATNLFPLIYAGTDAVNEYRKEWDRMGGLTKEQVENLSEFDNVLNELKTSASNVALQFGSSFLPLIKEFSNFLQETVIPVLRDLTRWFSELDSSQQALIFSILLLLTVLSTALKFIADISGGISTLITWLSKLDKQTVSTYGKWMLLVAAVGSLFNVLANWSRMNDTQKVVGLLGSLAAAALAAALAFGVFHSAWSMGAAVAGIIAGIAAATSAVSEAGKSIGADVSFGNISNNSSSNNAQNYAGIPQYTIPKSETINNTTNTNTNNYVDNSNIVINIEKNEYMTEDDIIKAVNKGLKQARQARK